MTKTGERLVKSAKQAADMARDGLNFAPSDLPDVAEVLVEHELWAEAAVCSWAFTRIQELEAELAETKRTLASMSQAGGAVRDYREWRDEMRQFAQLSGVHAGTHCIVPFKFIELVADPIHPEECSGADHYASNIRVWARRVQKQAQPFLGAMLHRLNR